MNCDSIEKRFVYLAIIFGVLFLLLTPPFQAPDEDSHFKKAYVISEGHFYPEVVNGKKGFYFSESMSEFIAETMTSIGNRDYKFSYSEVVAEEQRSVVYDDKEFSQFSTMSASPIGHIVPAFGILIGKIVATIAGREPSAVFLLYFARFFSLIAYIIMIAIAIKLTPILKNIFCVLGLMPMSLYLASSVSYDMLLIGGAFIFTALCFKLLYDSDAKWTKAYVLVFGLIAYIFYEIKIIYLPMYLLLLVVFWENYQANKHELKKIIVRFGSVLIVFVILEVIFSKIPGLIAAMSVIQGSTGPSGGSLSQQQLNFIIGDPIGFLKILYQAVKSGRNYYISSTVGLFGLVDTPIYSIFTYLYVFSVIVIGVCEMGISNVNIKWYHKMAVILPAFAGAFGAFLAMYIYWTPGIYGVGGSVIEGVQGRYFIPLMPPVFIIFGNKVIRKWDRVQNNAKRVVENGLLASVLILLVSIITITLRYWVS